MRGVAIVHINRTYNEFIPILLCINPMKKKCLSKGKCFLRIKNRKIETSEQTNVMHTRYTYRPVA